MRRIVMLTALSAPPIAAQAPDNTLWATNSSFSQGIMSVSKIDPRGDVITSTSLPGFTPFGLAVDPFGNVWAGSNGGTVAKIDVNGTLLNTYAVGSFPQSVASDGNGNIWVANRSSDSVTKLDNNGNVLAPTPTLLPAGTSPIGIIVDRSNQVWVSGFHSSSSTTHTLTVMDSAGTIVNTFSYMAPTGFAFSFPSVDADNDIWVANQGRGSIMQIDQSGNIVSETAITTGLPRGNQVDGLGFCWLANQGFAGNCVKIDQNGVIVNTFPLPSTTNFVTCSIDGNGDPWVFGFARPGGTTGEAIKLWQPDATPLVTVPIPASGSAWGGDTGAFHLANNVDPNGDYDADTVPNSLEIRLGTNPFDSRSTPANPLPIQSGLAVPGGSFNLTMRVRQDPNLFTILGASASDTPPTVLPDGRLVPLAAPVLILGLVVLDGNGDGRTSLSLPNNASLSGLTFHVAFATLDPAAPLGVRRISNNLPITIQ